MGATVSSPVQGDGGLYSTASDYGLFIRMLLNRGQLGQTRIFMVMARDGLLPKVFSSVHPKHRTPHVNTWVTGLLVALSCNVLTPGQAIGLCNIGTLFAFILVSLGVIVLRIREPDRPRPFRVPGYPVTPILSALACLGLVLGLDKLAGLKGAQLLRVKGVLNVEGEPVAVHAAQRIVHEPVFLSRWPDGERRSRLVERMAAC